MPNLRTAAVAVQVLAASGIPTRGSGVYAQTRGPRFEARANKWLAQVGDVVGMTGAHETTLCTEAELRYVMLHG